MKQVARNLTDMWDGFFRGKRYLIHDRDPIFTEEGRGLYTNRGLTVILFYVRYALSDKAKCIQTIIPGLTWLCFSCSSSSLGETTTAFEPGPGFMGTPVPDLEGLVAGARHRETGPGTCSYTEFGRV